MSRKLNIALAQINWVVGDIEGNSERMLQIVQEQKISLIWWSFQN